MPTVAEYAVTWLERRRALGYRSVTDDEARLRLHILPVIGSMLLEEVRKKTVNDMFVALRQKGLAPRTLHNISALGAALFRDAVAEEYREATPWVLLTGVLPHRQDADPAWRRSARFTRMEAESLCYDAREFPCHRVVNSLLYLAGLRRGEAYRLTLDDYDRTRKPLGGLLVRYTKTDVVREVPVHPALARILASWIMEEWPEHYGRRPGASDLLVQTRSGKPRNRHDDRNAFVAQCRRLGIEPRRGHDLRRTFISECRANGANRDQLQVVTHGPRGRDVLDMYTTYLWTDLCAAVQCLPVEQPGELIKLAR